jgi:hypothetical protein
MNYNMLYRGACLAHRVSIFQEMCFIIHSKLQSSIPSHAMLILLGILVHVVRNLVDALVLACLLPYPEFRLCISHFTHFSSLFRPGDIPASLICSPLAAAHPCLDMVIVNAHWVVGQFGTAVAEGEGHR